MLRRLCVVMVVVAVAPLAIPATVVAACDESSEFVFNVEGTNQFYGERSAVFAFDHHPMCGPNFHSTHMAIGPVDFIEIGLKQLPSDPASVSHFWEEYLVHPAPCCPERLFDNEFGFATNDFWYSFRIEANAGTAYQFGLYWAPGSDPTTASWRYMTNSPSFKQITGIVKGEESRYGVASAHHHQQRLDKQNRYRSSFSPWTNLQCNYNTMFGWKVVKYSNQRWKNEPVESPNPGLC